MNETIEKMQREAQKYGYLHNEDCACMTEDPDECECDNLKMVNDIIKNAVEMENARWISLAKAHRPHCTPDGNKDLTRMMGNKNRVHQPKDIVV